MVFKENNCKQNETGFVKKKKRNKTKRKIEIGMRMMP